MTNAELAGNRSTPKSEPSTTPARIVSSKTQPNGVLPQALVPQELDINWPQAEAEGIKLDEFKVAGDGQADLVILKPDDPSTIFYSGEREERLVSMGPEVNLPEVDGDQKLAGAVPGADDASVAVGLLERFKEVLEGIVEAREQPVKNWREELEEAKVAVGEGDVLFANWLLPVQNVEMRDVAEIAEPLVAPDQAERVYMPVASPEPDVSNSQVPAQSEEIDIRILPVEAEPTPGVVVVNVAPQPDSQEEQLAREIRRTLVPTIDEAPDLAAWLARADAYVDATPNNVAYEQTAVGHEMTPQDWLEIANSPEDHAEIAQEVRLIRKMSDFLANAPIKSGNIGVAIYKDLGGGTVRVMLHFSDPVLGHTELDHHDRRGAKKLSSFMYFEVTVDCVRAACQDLINSDQSSAVQENMVWLQLTPEVYQDYLDQAQAYFVTTPLNQVTEYERLAQRSADSVSAAFQELIYSIEGKFKSTQNTKRFRIPERFLVSPATASDVPAATPAAETGLPAAEPLPAAEVTTSEAVVSASEAAPITNTETESDPDAQSIRDQVVIPTDYDPAPLFSNPRGAHLFDALQHPDSSVLQRSAELKTVQGAFVGVGSPWKLLEQATAMKDCQGVILVDCNPVLTEAIFPAFVSALSQVPFHSDSDSYIQTIVAQMGQEIPRLLADIRQKYPDFAQAIDSSKSSNLKYLLTPELLGKKIQDSLNIERSLMGPAFILHNQASVEKVLDLFTHRKLASATLDLANPAVAPLLARALTQCQSEQIGAIDISNCLASKAAAGLIYATLKDIPSLQNSLILFSGDDPYGLDAKSTRDWDELAELFEIEQVTNQAPVPDYLSMTAEDRIRELKRRLDRRDQPQLNKKIKDSVIQLEGLNNTTITTESRVVILGSDTIAAEKIQADMAKYGVQTTIISNPNEPTALGTLKQATHMVPVRGATSDSFLNLCLEANQLDSTSWLVNDEYEVESENQYQDGLHRSENLSIPEIRAEVRQTIRSLIAALHLSGIYFQSVEHTNPQGIIDKVFEQLDHHQVDVRFWLSENQTLQLLLLAAVDELNVSQGNEQREHELKGLIAVLVENFTPEKESEKELEEETVRHLVNQTLMNAPVLEQETTEVMALLNDPQFELLKPIRQTFQKIRDELHLSSWQEALYVKVMDITIEELTEKTGHGVCLFSEREKTIYLAKDWRNYSEDILTHEFRESLNRGIELKEGLLGVGLKEAWIENGVNNPQYYPELRAVLHRLYRTIPDYESLLLKRSLMPFRYDAYLPILQYFGLKGLQAVASMSPNGSMDLTTDGLGIYPDPEKVLSLLDAVERPNPSALIGFGRSEQQDLALLQSWYDHSSDPEQQAFIQDQIRMCQQDYFLKKAFFYKEEIRANSVGSLTAPISPLATLVESASPAQPVEVEGDPAVVDLGMAVTNPEPDVFTSDVTAEPHPIAESGLPVAEALPTVGLEAQPTQLEHPVDLGSEWGKRMGDGEGGEVVAALGERTSTFPKFSSVDTDVNFTKLDMNGSSSEELTNDGIRRFLKAIKGNITSPDVKPNAIGFFSNNHIAQVKGAARGAIGILERYLENATDHESELRMLNAAISHVKYGIEVVVEELTGFIRPITKQYVILQPVDLSSCLKDKTQGILMRHDGYLYIEGYNNIKNVEKKGVFGNPGINEPTYLQFQDSEIQPSGWGEPTSREPISIYISPEKLQEKRTIFIDPETIAPVQQGDILGESFMILGGIPKEAIVGYSRIGDSEIIPI